MADARTNAREEAMFPTPVFRAQNVSSTAVALSGVTIATLQQGKLNQCWLTADGDIRYRYDGTSPTTTVGHILPENTPFVLNGRRKILALRFIGAAGAAAVVSFTLDHSSEAGGIQ